jgi:hypothetical protein
VQEIRCRVSVFRNPLFAAATGRGAIEAHEHRNIAAINFFMKLPCEHLTGLMFEDATDGRFGFEEDIGIATGLRQFKFRIANPKPV